MNGELEAALDGVYAAFANVVRPKSIRHAPPDELQPGEIKQLMTLPLRELSPGLLRSYLWDAVYFAPWKDFCYFLPRILEVSLTSEQFELETVAAHLKRAADAGHSLTAAQVGALHNFALAYWQDLLAHQNTSPLFTLDTLQTFGPARAELLALWRQHTNGAVHLAYELMGNGDLPPEWPKAEAIAWLEAAFFAESDAEKAQLISNALLVLQA